MVLRVTFSVFLLFSFVSLDVHDEGNFFRMTEVLPRGSLVINIKETRVTVAEHARGDDEASSSVADAARCTRFSEFPPGRGPPPRGSILRA